MLLMVAENFATKISIAHIGENETQNHLVGSRCTKGTKTQSHITTHHGHAPHQT